MYTAMEAAASYLLMIEKYVNSKQNPSLGNISEAFTIDKVEKRGLKGVVKCFSVDFNPIDINNVLDVHKYLMNRT